MTGPEAAQAPSEPRVNLPEVTPLQRDRARLSVALEALGKHVYAGTVPPHVKARRRAKNRVAKRSRKANR